MNGLQSATNTGSMPIPMAVDSKLLTAESGAATGDSNTAAATEPVQTKDRTYFANQIRIRWSKARESILEVGRLIIQARETLPREEYSKFIKNDLPFNYSTLQKLKNLAQNEKINDPKNKDLLPHSWNTLCEVIHLSDEAFEAGIQRKIIRPDCQWKEVKTLREEFDPELAVKRANKASARVNAGKVIPMPKRSSRTAKTPQSSSKDARTETAHPQAGSDAAEAPLETTTSTAARSPEDIPADSADACALEAHVTDAAPDESVVATTGTPTTPPQNRVVVFLSKDVADRNADGMSVLKDLLHRLIVQCPFIEAWGLEVR